MLPVDGSTVRTVTATNSSTPSLTSSAAWQTAIAEAKGSVSSIDGYHVVKYGSDNGAATATDIFGDKLGPEGIVTVDRHTNTITVTQLDPQTGKVATYPTDSGANIPIQATVTEDSNGNFIVNGQMEAKYEPGNSDNYFIQGKNVAFDFYGQGVNYHPVDGSISPPDITVDVADSIGGYSVTGSSTGLGAVVMTPTTNTPASTEAVNDTNDFLTLNTNNPLNNVDSGDTSRISSDYTSNFATSNMNDKYDTSPQAPSAPSDWVHIFEPWKW